MAACHALEDAGYSDKRLEDHRCAVFAGVCGGDYESRLAQAGDWGEAHVFTGNATSILAGRLPYLLNLKGAGVAVDTACSASLVAIHLACESLRSGSNEMALAGGVAVMSTARFHVWASKAGMLSASGRCRTFGAEADGIAPAEGVGVLLLKRLDDALRDGDPIHGVIRGSGINQNGRTNGITAPSAPAQAELLTRIYRDFRIDPSTIDYVECHGTGTRLGDPMEVTALTDAFRAFTDRSGYCALGAVKSNIGHSLAAAGVAGVLKVLLSLRHERIPATLHCDRINEHVSLDGTPFTVACSAQVWPRQAGRARRAAVSAFGFSGANAHVVIEEAPPRAADPRPASAGFVFAFSAHTGPALRRRLADAEAWLATAGGATASAADVSFTLNVGRTHFGRRWATVATSVADLRAKLREALASSEFSDRVSAPAGIARGVSRELLRRARGEQGERDGERAGALAEIGRLYRAGADVDWAALHAGRAGRCIAMPGYPFELRRCWIEVSAETEFRPVVPVGPKAPPPSAPRQATTSLGLAAPEIVGGERRHRIELAPEAPVLAQHRVRGRAILPGVASLQFAVAAGEVLRAGCRPVLRDVTWLRPLMAAGEGLTKAALSLIPSGRGDGWRFSVRSSGEDGGEGLCMQGELAWDAPAAKPAPGLDLEALSRRCGRLVQSGEFYHAFAEGGVDYGPYFRVVRECWIGRGEVLARLEAAPEFADEVAELALHPSLLDGALQAGAALAWAGDAGEGAFRFPFGVARVEILGALCRSMWVHAQGSVETGVTLTLADEEGRVAVVLSGYVTRAPRQEDEAAGSPYFEPVWELREVSAPPESAAGPAWVVMRAEGPFEDALAALHPETVKIRLGLAAEGMADGALHLDVAGQGAWAKLLEKLPRPGTIYFSTGEISGDDFGDELECVRVAKEQGVLALFRLVKALQAKGWWAAGLALKIVTRRVWPVAAGETAEPYFAALTGLAGTLGREYPDIGAACIDLGAADPALAAAEAKAVLGEPLHKDSPRVAWRAGRRLEARLNAMEAAP